MKTRIIVAAIGLPLLLVALLVPTPIPTLVLVSLLSVIGAYELLYNAKYARNLFLMVLASAMGVGVCIWSFFDLPASFGKVLFLLFFVALFAKMLIDAGKEKNSLKLRTVGIVLIAGALIPYLLSAIVRLRCLENGAFYVLVPFILSMVPDSGAYFVGRAMGKHKLAPVISPNKTVEGAVGGLITGALAMVLYGLILQLIFKFEVNYFFAVIYGILGAVISIFGDLTFSAMKRQVGIKDFGNLLPGHGGVLDRFDSTAFVAPLVEVLLLLIPFAVK